MKIQLKDIIVDPSIDIRQKLDEATIQEYMDIFDRLPPVVVYDTQEGFLLADGFHRFSAAERLGRLEIPADVKKGTRNDVIEFAAYANAIAALKLTSEERRIGIRRLHRLHPDWDNKRIASLMQCSDRVVVTTITAIKVRRESPTSIQLTDRHVEEISRAPQEHWESLAETAVKKNWTVEETSVAIQNINDSDLPTEHKKALIKGETEPILTEEGEPKLLRQTIKRHLAQEAKRDYLSFLEGALYQLGQLRRFTPKEIVGGLEVQRLSSLVRELPKDINFLNDIIKLGCERLEI